MLDNIKSTYFKKIIFSLLDEKAKLKILRYNKNLQKQLNIEFINYFIFTKKYSIKETNGFSKTYIYNPYYEDNYDDTLIFEGEYLNGKKNGKCKEYEYGSIKFEGEYLNGKINGKGKEYTYEGSLSFEGEYMNGERNGKGKEFYNDKIIFESEYLNGEKFVGKGIDYEGNIYHENRKKEG